MILSSVSETLASVSRHPALESAIAALRQGNPRERLAGLTDTGKALLAAIVVTELRRPMVVLVESGARAEVFAASMQFFYAALAGQEATEVTVLPAMDVLPWQDAAPHAEILENRAVTLWRYSTGQARRGCAGCRGSHASCRRGLLRGAGAHARARRNGFARRPGRASPARGLRIPRHGGNARPIHGPQGESSTFSPRKPSGPCASNCSEIRSNLCASLIPTRSVPFALSSA